ncbi:uncharacterized protein E0L32_009518 [Thyridium curvatum]|uniref:NAD-dependent epimerase/dehydratase domain-containing protein n=1 Tax=Thyridium curvatum TaxID=1093900 RepID=A0A507ARK9_9PEZI|nr:uncharacterized protein E0L32_009518 [Thyridium curvatum]TPX09326.1 hypothetical protein E0L32_009518 [Thyridium curvatum]
MALKIFLTGVTGYIGGDIFYEVYNAHPEYEWSVLVRNEERGKLVSDKYPKVRLVYGSLHDAGVLEKEAAAADIVIHTADSADDVPSATAIAKGLAAGHTPERPAFWLHICGTGILQWYDAQEKRYGQPPLPDQRYGDVTDIARIASFPDAALHRDVDKVVLACAAGHYPAVRVAVVGPPCIYGPGRGPVNGRSIQAYDMARFMLREGFAPVAGAGLAEWDNVHVHDVARLFRVLVDAAQDARYRDDAEVFGPRAYYFVANGVHSWGQVARWLAEEAYKQGFMGEVKAEEITLEAMRNLESKGNASWFMNSKGVPERAKKYFGFQPQGRSLQDEIPDIVAGEAKLLGIKPTGHTH